jgi:hypothetical protein
LHDLILLSIQLKRCQVRSRSQASKCTGTCTLQYKKPANTSLNQVTHACKTPYIGPWNFTFLYCPQQQKNKQTNPKKSKNQKKKKISQFLGYMVPNHNEKTNPKKKNLSLLSLQQQTNEQTKKEKQSTVVAYPVRTKLIIFRPL